ncbi:hypothetical protein V8G54_024045 [Vigna mungo]|uniref:Uncharacterized protein n=1 Tax=Vigna mungo TaxID=3915 RepID=A0AAQ3N595_VIGMU
MEKTKICGRSWVNLQVIRVIRAKQGVRRRSQSATTTFRVSISGFLVIDGEEDDLVNIDVVLVVQPGASSGRGGLLRTSGFGGVNGRFAVMVEDDDDLWLATDSEVEVVEIRFDGDSIAARR